MNRFTFPKKFEHFLDSFPLVLVDVGASGGIQEKWKSLSRFLRVIGFEPDERSARELRAHSETAVATTFLSVGLYNKKARIPLYLTRSKTDSSLLQPNVVFLKKFPHLNRLEIVGRDLMNVDTLDSQLNTQKITDIDFMKVDTQGTELYILEGATDTLRRAMFGVEVEVEFSPVYLNQPLFADVDVFMRNHGFQLFDLAPCFWKRKIGKDLGGERGQIIFANALYLKDSEVFMASLQDLSYSGSRKSKVLRGIIICLLHGYADYAREILDLAQTFFTHEEYEALTSYVIESGKPKSIIPHFFGRATLASFFSHVAHILKPASHDWKTFRNDVGS